MIDLQPSRPLRVLALVKQVPDLEDLRLGAAGRLDRSRPGNEMDAYARRAAALGVALARASGGTCIAATMGPVAARDVLRECLAGGVDEAVHISDELLVGADTLVTARVLARLVQQLGGVDLVLAGRASIDAETGQVPPQLAELLGLPFAGGCRTFSLVDDHLELGLEHDDLWVEVEGKLPAIVTCAERLLDPLKLKEPAQWRGIDEQRIRHLTVADLGGGLHGADSPTWVESVEEVAPPRAPRRFDGTDPREVRHAVDLLVERGALDVGAVDDPGTVPMPRGAESGEASGHALVVVEPGEGHTGHELLGAAALIASRHTLPSRVVACVEHPAAGDLEAVGADAVRTWRRDATPAGIASALAGLVGEVAPWCVLLPATDWGREVGARLAARTGAGMTGDALALALDAQGQVMARKAAFGGSAEAVVRCRTPLHVVTVRPGVLPRLQPRDGGPLEPRELQGSEGEQFAVRERRRLDGGALLTADRVVGVGQGVAPDELQLIEPLLEVLCAEVAATRKVTDAGWLPRARQLGVTGHAIAPRLYVAVGISGKITHTAGVRRAHTILAIDWNPDAAMLAGADIALVGDWRVVVPLLVAAIAEALRLSDVDLS